MKKQQLKKRIKKIEEELKNFNYEEEIKDYMDWLRCDEEKAKNAAFKKTIFLKATLASLKNELASA